LGVLSPDFNSDPDPDPDPVPDEKECVMKGFDHEKLDVYKTAIEFVALSQSIVRSLPKGSSYLANQLHRAAISVPLNIAEGAGEFSRKDKARFYRMALRSTTESAAIIDICRELELSGENLTAPARELLLRIVAMLTAMVRSLSKAKSGSGSGSGSGPGSGPQS
jgi:four helix bundle protein